MVLLGLLQSGGSVLGQAMEQVTGGNLLSTLLIACAFTLSLVYLFRLAVGHMVQLPAGAVRAPQGLPLGPRPGRASERAGPGALAGEGAPGAGWRLQTDVRAAADLVFAGGGGGLAGPQFGAVPFVRRQWPWPSGRERALSVCRQPYRWMLALVAALGQVASRVVLAVRNAALAFLPPVEGCRLFVRSRMASTGQLRPWWPSLSILSCVFSILCTIVHDGG